MAKILWVDNDVVFLRPAKLRLKLLGHEVNQATTLTQATIEIETNPYDLVILDLMMPVKLEEENLFPPSETNNGRKSGLALYRRLKSTLESKKIRSLVLTIREESELKKECLEAGISERNYITKSEISDLSLLADRVKQALEN